MGTYNAIYKCRLCGEEFESGKTGEDIAAAATILMASVGNTKKLTKTGAINKKCCHFCENGSYGIADFMGFRKDDEE